MPPRNPVFVVCSPRPRVGRTLIARALAEYLDAAAGGVAAFDVNPGDFAMVENLPAITAVATLDDTRGEMALFDQLIANDRIPKVVDLGAGQFDRFFSILRATGAVAEAQRNAVAIAVLYVCDPDPRARQGYAMLRDRFSDLILIPVLNAAVPVVERYRDDFPPTASGGEALLIPAISPLVKAVVARPGFSFAEFCRRTSDPTNELYEWTRRVYLEFRDVELRILLEGIKPALRTGS